VTKIKGLKKRHGSIKKQIGMNRRFWLGKLELGKKQMKKGTPGASEKKSMFKKGETGIWGKKEPLRFNGKGEKEEPTAEDMREKNKAYGRGTVGLKNRRG